MKKDIAGRRDIELVLAEFYSAAMADAKIGHHFAELDLTGHLPVITDFWEKVLFGKPVYFGNPLAVHMELHRKNPLKPGHFGRWLEIFDAAIDVRFAGVTAETAKARARAIAESLMNRLGNEIANQRTM